MGRATSKIDLVSMSEEKYNELSNLINLMSEEIKATPFDFSKNNKKEAHWERDKNIRDIYIHLYEWHQLLLQWVNNNLEGIPKPFLLEPYNWRNYGEMNIKFVDKHQNTSYEKAKELFEKSHKDIMELANKFTNEELFNKNQYKWVGGSTLGSYFVSVTASHYDWAIKKLKLHIKNCSK